MQSRIRDFKTPVRLTESKPVCSMIVTEKKSWLWLVLALQGSTLLNTWPRIAVAILMAVVVESCAHLGWLKVSLTPAPFTVVGLALAIFLGFRNNAAYDRYWEGRKLLGALVNVTRNFALKTRVIMQQDSNAAINTRAKLVRITLAYVNSLRHRLRETVPSEDLREYLSEEQLQIALKHNNIPLAVLDQATEVLVDQWKQGNLETYQLSDLQNDISRMLDVQGGCERIQATPIPFTYSVLTHRTVMLYCLALPFGIHDLVGWALPLVVGFVSYAFLSLDDLADEIEQLFGLQPNSLPLHAICRTIEINLLQVIETADEQVPEPIAPVDGILV